VKSHKIPFSLRAGGRHSGESRNPVFFKQLQTIWTPVFTGVTTFYECIKVETNIFPGFGQNKNALKTNVFLPCNLLRNIL